MWKKESYNITAYLTSFTIPLKVIKKLRLTI